MKAKYLNALEEAKLRTSRKDRIYVGPTAKGQYNEGLQKAQEIFREMFKGISKEELERLVENEMNIRDLQIIQLQNQLNEPHYSFKEAWRQD